MKRLAIFIVLPIVMVVLLVAAATGWLVYTESGLNWTARRVTTLTDGAISIGSVSGAWARDVVIDELVYKDTGRVVRVTDVELSLRLRALLAREVHVEHLHIGEVEYQPRERAKPASAGDGYALPVRLLVPQARIDRITLQNDAEQTAVDIQFAGAWEASTIQIERLTGVVRDAELALDGALYLRESLGIDANLTWRTSLANPPTELAGSGRVSGNFPDLEITHELIAPERVVTQGRVTLGETIDVDLVNKSEIVFFQLGDRRASVQKPVVKVSGWLDDYRLEFGGDVSVADLPAMRIDATAAGNLEKLNVDPLTVGLPQGRLDARGVIGLRPAITWALDVQADAVDPALVLPDWPGKLTGRFELTGAVADGRIDTSVRDVAVEGTLRGYPLTARGAVHRDGGALVFDDVRIANGRNTVEIDGRFGKTLAFDFAVDAERLGFLGPDFDGALKGSGRIGGTRDAPQVRANLVGRDLRWKNYVVGQLEALGQVAPGSDASDLVIKAARVVVDDRKIGRVEAGIAGNLDAHRLTISASAFETDIDAELAGGWSDGAWTGEITRSTLERAGVGIWRQERPATFRVSSDGVGIERFCIGQSAASACIDGAASRDALDITARIEALPFDPLAKWLPAGTRVESRIDVDARITGTPASPRAQLSGGTREIAISYAGAEETAATTLRDLSFTGELAPDSLEARLNVAGDFDSALQLNGRIDDWRGADKKIKIDVDAAIPDLAFVAAIAPEIADAAGSLNADLTLTGSVDSPDVDGEITLTGGRAVLRRAGITLENVNASVRPVSGSRLQLRANGQSGDGSMTVDGLLTLDKAAGWPVTGTVQGERFTIIDRPDVNLVVSPDLKFSGNARAVAVTGSVKTPRAVVTLRELPSQAVRLSDDVIVYGVTAPAQKKASGPKVSVRLNLELGEDVSFSGFGLRTDLAGRMAVNYEPDKGLTGQGSVEIEAGQFQAYGQSLEIDRGTLVFTGPIDDPALDVVAVRSVNEIKVGLRLGGTGLSPEASVFSNPAMTEGDALAYLLTGRPLAGVTTAEGEGLRQSAIGLGLKQASAVTDAIGQAVGLDEFSLDTGDIETGAIMAGKRLTPELYVRYSYGLFSRAGALLLRYRLSQHVSLEARSSAEEQTMDIIYSRERK